MSVVEQLHHHRVAPRRVMRLSAHLAGLVPPDSTVLDVGCGDGRIAHALAQQRPDLTLRGVDVLRRADVSIPVEIFDGRSLPQATRGMDAVLLIDTVHHAHDRMGLLREAARVARRAVIIKDHVSDEWLATPTLQWMDRIGNARFGVASPGAYWRRAEWEEAFRRLGLRVANWETRLGLYPWPVSLVCERAMHFLALLEPSGP